MKRKNKILLGIATIWQPVYMVLFMLFVFGMILLTGPGEEPGNLSPIFAGGFLLIFLLHFITIFLIMGLMVYYIVHAIKNESLSSDMRIVWVLLFVFVGIVAEPVYWYTNIWKVADTVPAGGLPPMDAGSWAATGSERTGSYDPPNEPPDWR